jgi:hypothetical protein
MTRNFPEIVWHLRTRSRTNSMKISVFTISALAAVGACSTGWPIQVTLAAKGGSLVEIQITNKGGSDVNLFQRATLLDSNPNRKFNISTLQGTYYGMVNPAHVSRRNSAVHRH